jgi:hypothetical protein
MVTLGERYIDVHCTLLATFLWGLFFKIKHSREEERIVITFIQGMNAGLFGCFPEWNLLTLQPAV